MSLEERSWFHISFCALCQKHADLSPVHGINSLNVLKMINHHMSWPKQIGMQLNRVANQL